MSFVKNKTLILTGASHGVGKALALELADRGVHLVLNARTESTLEEVAAECLMKRVKTALVVGNVASGQLVTQMVKEARSIGAFIGFVHAAGVLHPGPAVWEMTKSKYDDVVSSSMTGAYQLIRHVVPEMRRIGHGVAVFFGSGAADITQPGIGAYCAAKAGEEQLARHLAAEDSILHTIIYRPGKVETRMQENARNAKGAFAEPVREIFTSWKENGELLTPEDSARFLADILENPTEYNKQTVRPD